jgi:hypothetical protein
VAISDNKAALFTVDGDVAHKAVIVVMGEAGPSVFFSPDALKPATLVVVEGRALLKDGDRVAPKMAAAEPTGSSSNVLAGGHVAEKAP